MGTGDFVLSIQCVVRIPLPGHGGGITQHGDWLQALDLPSALVQQTGQFPVHVWIAPVLTKTPLTGLAQLLNGPCSPKVSQ